MTSTRPKRRVQPMSYKHMMESDLEDVDCASSVSDLSYKDLSEHPTIKREDEDSVTDVLPDVIRLPTASDILETEALLRTQAAKIAAIDAEYRVMKRNMASFEQKRTVMIKKFLKNKAYLARIRTLPQDVLGLVFLFYVDDPVQSPWILMQVTRTWRATALATRAIWARIRITLPAWKKSGASRRKDGREMCISRDQLDRALRRAGNTALDIQFALINPLFKWAYRRYDITAIEQMISLLVSSRKCLQVHRLEIEGPDNYHLRWWSGENDLKFPELRKVLIKSRGYADFATKISKTSKQLIEVELVWGSNDRTPSSATSLTKFMHYPSLTTLSLNGQHLLDKEINKLHHILDNVPFLNTLELNSVPLSRNSNVLRLPNLQHLILKAVWDACSFDMPCLTNLTLAGHSQIQAGRPGANNFPLLTSLRVEASTGWSPAGEWRSNITFPPLHTLDVCFGTRKDELKELIKYQAELNPIVLCLRKTSAATDLLVQVVDSMIRLEELQLEEVALKKGFFEFLASPKTSFDDSATSPLSRNIMLNCPLLVRLQVQLKGGTRAQNRSLKSMARRAINARVKAGIAMERLLIRSSEDKQWTNYVP